MIATLMLAGLLALWNYVATHVLTCLVPAFLIAGAMVTFVRREAVLQYLGADAGTLASFSVAAAASFLLAACSCTVIPVASGLYYSGAGIGPAFIVLWVAPAANLLALLYTGNILGTEMVIARVAAALLMAFAVGLVMSATFGDEPGVEAPAGPTPEHSGPIIGGSPLVLLALLLLSLLVPNYLVRTGAYPYKIAAWGIFMLAAAAYARAAIPRTQVNEWLRETWWFVRMIFPLLLLGVFAVGIVGALLPQHWIERWLGGNGLGASFLATLLGAFSYFATMTEAPFVDTLESLGMGRGPALALLLTGPGISLPNWLAIARVFGWRKALVYVPTIVILGTLVGWFSGNVVLSEVNP